MTDRGDRDEEGKEDDVCPTQRDVEELKKKIKAPDRAKFERELEKINSAIRELEAKYRSFQSLRSQGSASSHVGKDRETLMTELRSLKAERDQEIDTRKKIDQELKGVNALVQQKNDACGRVQGSLKFKTETRVNEAIRRLEHQLRVQQLKLREEKRLVSEIDSLKRSKKLIHEFDALKQEISQLRDRQNALRKQRDSCMKTISKLKSKEEEIKSLLDEQRTKDMEAKLQQRGYNNEKSALKKEIDDLYARRRTLVNVFNKEREEHTALLRDIREQERHIKREVEAMKRIEQRHLHKQKLGSESAVELTRDTAHQAMINVCDSLITYIKGLNACPKIKDTQAINEQPLDIKGNEASFSGGSFLKKKMDDDLEEMYAGAARRSSRRGSRRGKRSAHRENAPKKLVLHAAVMEQFLSLAITPPSTAAEIHKVLELLIKKKENLHSVVDLHIPMARAPSPSTSSESSLENFPSLPSMQESASTADCTAVKDEPVNRAMKDEFTNEECPAEGIVNDANLRTQKEIKDNFQDVGNHNDTELTDVGKIEESDLHSHHEVEIENIDERCPLTREKYSSQGQKCNISNSPKQNGSLYKEVNNLKPPMNTVKQIDLLSRQSNDEVKNLNIKENDVCESIVNHANDMEDGIICRDDEKHCSDPREDQPIVKSTDDMNSSIKCPS